MWSLDRAHIKSSQLFTAALEPKLLPWRYQVKSECFQNSFLSNLNSFHLLLYRIVSRTESGLFPRISFEINPSVTNSLKQDCNRRDFFSPLSALRYKTYFVGLRIKNYFLWRLRKRTVLGRLISVRPTNATRKVLQRLETWTQPKSELLGVSKRPMRRLVQDVLCTCQPNQCVRWTTNSVVSQRKIRCPWSSQTPRYVHKKAWSDLHKVLMNTNTEFVFIKNFSSTKADVTGKAANLSEHGQSNHK